MSDRRTVSEIDKHVSKRIREIRLSKGISQAKLGDALLRLPWLSMCR